MQFRYVLCLSLVIMEICITSLSIADVYKYINPEGVYCFTDDPGKIPEKYRSDSKADDTPSSFSISEPTEIGIKSNKNISKNINQRRKAFDGTIYLHVRDNCPYGDKAEQYLKKIGANFKRQDHQDKSPLFKFDDKLYTSVVLIIGNRRLTSSDEYAIKEAIESGGN